MLFSDVLKKHEALVAPDFERLVGAGLANQAHPGDMLVWLNNGSYNEEVLQFKHPVDGKTYNPHVIGQGDIGLSEQAHYKFIDQYRQGYLSKLSFTEYLKELEYSEARRVEIDGLVDIEETTINLEMLVYLKFWESDSIIKKLYELVRIANAEPYDWYFKVAESNRDTDATGTRQDIIRKAIRDRIQNFPEVYKAIKSAYKTQIRNAIAHSKYAFQGRNIHLHNFVAADKAAQLQNVTFDDWIDIFHLTIILHNCYIRATDEVSKYYAQLASQNNNEVQILVTEKTIKQYTLPLIFRPEFKDWRYKQVK